MARMFSSTARFQPWIFWLASGLLAVAAPPTAVPVWPAAVADPYIVYVRAISSAGDIGAKPPLLTRFANALTGAVSESQTLNHPFGVSVDEAGNLVVTDTGANAVSYLELARKKWSRWTEIGHQRWLSPVAAIHAGATFYVADSGLGKVIAFDEKGRLECEFTNELARPSGLAWLHGRLLIVDSERHQVVTCSPQGAFIAKFGRRGKQAGEFNFPTHIAVDARDQIYVTDSLNSRIQVFTADGTFVRQFGSAGDGPGHFTRPKGVAVDTQGHVYVVDAVFGNVQIFDDQGRLLLDFGDSGAAPGQFCLPNAIAINSRNEIFVADTYNHRLQMFRYTGRK